MSESKDLFKTLRRKIYQNEGKGFTVEVNAEVIKCEIYIRKQPAFFTFDPKWTWKFYKTDKKTKYIESYDHSKVRDIYSSGYELRSPNTYVHLAYSISSEIEQNLPEGIIIHKSDPIILLDERDFFRTKHDVLGKYTHIDLINNVENIYEEERKAHYIEGRRVYLTVTDEYAWRVYREICDSITPCQNIFLTRHKELMEDIVRGTDEIFANHRGQYISISYLDIDICVGYGDDWGLHKRRCVSFESIGMKPLSTHEQLIEIAFAIIGTVQSMYPVWEAIPLTLEHEYEKIKIINNSITILFRERRSNNTPSDNKKLSDW